MNIIEDKDLLAFDGKQQSQNIIKPSDMADAVVELFAAPNVMEGLRLPWPCTHEQFSLRTSEVTLWAGVNGHGKSLMLGQVCAQTLPDTSWLIASLEMPVKQTLRRMVRQMAGLSNPSDAYIRTIMKTMQDRLWIYDRLDTVPANVMLAVIHYASQELGIKHIMIDSLVKCGMAVDDYNAQKHFVDQLCVLAKRYDIGIHLVHHIRKGEREGKRPDKFDIKGAGEISDLVDNICIVHRNKDKERQVRAGEDVPEGVPDGFLIVAKQRHYGIEQDFPLYYHADSLQYLSSPSARPFQSVNNFSVRAG